MKMKTTAQFLVFVILATLVLSSSSVAISVGVSPGTLTFENLLRGGYAEAEILVSTSGSETLSGSIDPRGDIPDWLSFEPQSFEIGPKNPTTKIKVIIQPPVDVANGAYEGIISVSVRPKVTSEVTGTGVSVGAAAGIKTTAMITDKEIKRYTVKSVSVKDIEEGHPAEVSVVMENTGNVRVTPKIHIDILDQNKQDVITSVDYEDTTILPTSTETILITIPTDDFDLGQYWARVTAYLDGQEVKEETLTFDLLERGALRVKGELKSVTAGAWTTVGDLVIINASFSNTGEMITLAKAKFEIYSEDGALKDVFDSEEIQVGIGETTGLTAYYRPQVEGRYDIYGVVYYSKKISDKKSTVLNVQPKPAAEDVVTQIEPTGTDYTPFLVIAVLVIIGIFVFRFLNTRGRSRRKSSINR
jgi:hypothetical protein